jgi:hypothetical protein
MYFLDKSKSLQEQDDWFPQIIPVGDHGEIIMNSDGSILIKGGDFKHIDEQRRRSFDKSEDLYEYY